VVARDARSAELVARLHAGEERALAEIIRLYQAPLASFVARMVRRTPDDVDDILQRVFFRLWENRATLNRATSLRAYLFTAARNHVLNHVRDHAHEQRHVALEDDSAVTSSVAAELEAKDLADAVWRAIERLPARCQEIFLLSRDGGLSYPEIAAATGVTVNTVKTQMSRALTALTRAAAPFLAVTILAHTVMR
jgi:RNA polymerase sigma-70 factor (ECF subfamily)